MNLAVLHRAVAIREDLILVLECDIENNLINLRTMEVEFSRKKFKSELFSVN